MAKVFEEEWFTKMRGTGVELLREGVAEEDEDLPLIARSFEQRSGDMQIPRMDLAAAAPDMARVLLAIEWSDTANEPDGCPSCGEPKHIGHDVDCALDAALRKAGVR
jgi:hypothetical protein